MDEMNNHELTLLSEGQIWGNSTEKRLKVLRKYGIKAAISDLGVLTGSYLCKDTDYNVSDSSLNNLKGRTGCFWTKTDDKYNGVRVDIKGDRYHEFGYRRNCAVRPVLQSSLVYSQISPNKVRGYNDTYEVEYGEYPQYAVDDRMQRTLELRLNKVRLNKTGRNYTFDSTKYDDCDTGFIGVTYDEYEYRGRKFIRVKANPCYSGRFELSNGIEYKNGDFVWVEVSPVKWLVDDETETLISKIGLVSGIRYCDIKTPYKGDFDRTEMKAYLDKHMSRDLFQSVVLTRVQDVPPLEKIELSEEETLRLQIEKSLAKLDSEKLKQKYADIVGNYTDKISSLIPGEISDRKNQEIKLTLKSVLTSKDYHKLYLEELSKFLDKLSQSEGIIDEINCGKDIINGLNIENPNEFLKDIITLTGLYNHLDEKQKKRSKEELSHIFEEERKVIIDGLLNDNIEMPYKDIKEFEINFRVKLQRLILKFKEDYELFLVSEKISQTTKTFKSIEKSQYDVLLLYMESIKQSINRIESLLQRLPDEELLKKLEKYKEVKIDLDKGYEENAEHIIALFNDVLALEAKLEYIYEPVSYVPKSR